MKLVGKIALVTGAGQGIGKGIAEVLADEGADIVINDIYADERCDALAEAIQKKGRRSNNSFSPVLSRRTCYSQPAAASHRGWPV